MKSYKLRFEHKGINHEVVVAPEDYDWWTTVISNGTTFDIHYSDDYKHIVVYEATDDVNHFKLVYEFRLRTCVTCGDVAQEYEYIEKNGGMRERVPSCERCYGKSI